MASYTYKPLRLEREEIRLVYLLPGKKEDLIKICITHTLFSLPPPPDSRRLEEKSIQLDSLQASVSHPWTIEEIEGGDLVRFNVYNGETHLIESAASSLPDILEFEPAYEALSYTWGEANVSEHVQVEHSLEGPGASPLLLEVRPNLASALRHLRANDGVRVLWIDAICINQEDIEERNEQVKRMAHIYKYAKGVVAWLGEEACDSHHAVATLQYVGRQLASTKSGRVIASPNATEPNFWRNDTAPSFNQKTWKSLVELVARTWFYRLWCWQEIQLGGRQAHIQVGSDTIRWNDFWLAILCLHNKENTYSMWFRERCRYIAFLKHDTMANSLCNMLDIGRSKGCSDPRDKIYGLLGLTPTSFTANIAVDYLRPVEHVYKEAFLAHLNVTKRLELLKHCDLANRTINGPSWVTDWSKTEFAAPILSEQLSTGVSRAWGELIGPDTLEVVGKRCATIQSISAVAPKDDAKTLLVVKKWYNSFSHDRSYVTGERIEEAFALTLCMDRTRERHPYNHFLSISDWVGMVSGMLRLTETSLQDPIYASRETANTIQKIRGRRFFTTEEGYIGTAPAGARVGDSICLILGAYAPIILRPTASAGFQVVGECYVHGLSFSNGLLGPLPSGWHAIIRGDALGRPIQRFARSAFWSREETDDPRLGHLPTNWARATYDRQSDDPAIFEKYRNLKTGELINYDPRLSPAALEAHGVTLERLRLV